ncbi:cell division protein Cdc14 [Microdochium trichocladiopsis]|uniref:Cell division protein Cdc14 n=1 Tax=Microdochium trichocladiopsis TaxID=1682393 RepID=A0A9P8XZY9_9PEZI|nr:cell division protein Cdc14 [Microdochium trichocladiopsis]KAH7026237.1 cell division protein Cdc14 [Microdochium trichocladiopsis]
MENLLSLAFDNLSSYDGPKIRKGLRQIEGLLANICLSRGGGKRSKERRDSVMTDSIREDSPTPPSTLLDLTDDPAFYEFFKLQEGFEWNVALRLVNTLDRLLARGADGSNDLLIMNALDLTQGILLLHPPSKAIFGREMYMNLLLDLLEPDFCPAIQSATLLTIVTALIDMPQNTRTFENLDGLLTVTSLFRSRGTSREVKLKLVEFLYFYLMPEVPSIPSAAARDSMPGLLQRSPSKLAKAFVGGGSRENGGRPRADSDACEIRSQEEKQALLGRHLNSVEELVKDLQQSTPFGGAVC